MKNRINDEIAACNRIRSARREEREYARRTRKVKSITTPLEIINGRRLSAHLAVSINSITGTVLIQSNSIIYYKHRIHPGTHGKRKCGSEKALKCLKMHEDVAEKVAADVENKRR